MQEDEKSKELNTGSTHSVEGSTGSTTSREQQPMDTETSHAKRSSGSNVTRSPKLRGATGPRSLAGKQRSRRNAMKSGLFAKILLVEGESSAAYQALRKGVFKDLLPQGAIEIEVVENVVAILWRIRRMLRAESSQIASLAEGEDRPRNLKDVLQRWGLPFEKGDSGRILNFDSPQEFLKRAIELLSKCGNILSKRGYQQDDVQRLFREFYGVQTDEEVPAEIFHFYQDYSRINNDVSTGKEFGSFIGNSEQDLIGAFGDELYELEFVSRMKRSTDEPERERQAVTAHLPPQVFSEQIIRGQAHLSRELDRNLNRLERLQRMRRGQPGPPTLNVEING